MSTIRSFRDLQVWQKAVDLSVTIYKLTDSFPKHEQYGLTSQMRRAAVSVASNLAEGHGRSNAEFARYIQISRGSLFELQTQIEISHRIGYMSQDAYDNFLQETNILGRQLTKLWQVVKN